MARTSRRGRFRVDAGQGLVEYALILTLIAVVVIVALQFLGTTVRTLVSGVGASV